MAPIAPPPPAPSPPPRRRAPRTRRARRRAPGERRAARAASPYAAPIRVRQRRREDERRHGGPRIEKKLLTEPVEVPSERFVAFGVLRHGVRRLAGPDDDGR